MKHLRKFNENFEDTIRHNGDISEILTIVEKCGIFDDFPYLSMNWYGSKIHNFCLDYGVQHNMLTREDADYLKNNSITIEFDEDHADSWDKRAIYYIEPKVWEYIKECNVRLGYLGYQIIYNDYGSADCSYELVICDKDYKLSEVKETDFQKYRKNKS